MTLRYRLASFALALTTVFAAGVRAAHAQGALYITPVASRVTTANDTDPTFSFLGKGVTSRIFYGVGLGGYYDVPQLTSGQLEVGIDVRDSILHGNNAFLNNFLVGPRIAVAPLKRPFHFYVEPVVGVGTTHSPNTEVKLSKVEFGIFGGVDWKFSRVVTWRVIEGGYSTVLTTSGGSIGGSESIPKAQMINFTSGLTFNLPAFKFQ
jgi:hypothetical protein